MATDESNEFQGLKVSSAPSSCFSIIAHNCPDTINLLRPPKALGPKATATMPAATAAFTAVRVHACATMGCGLFPAKRPAVLLKRVLLPCLWILGFLSFVCCMCACVWYGALQAERFTNEGQIRIVSSDGMLFGNQPKTSELATQARQYHDR